MKLEQKHQQQHEAGTTTRSWNIIINMWQHSEIGASSTTFVVLF
jgi:hypothetical protein